MKHFWKKNLHFDGDLLCLSGKMRQIKQRFFFIFTLLNEESETLENNS